MLALTVGPPQDIELPAVINVLVAESIALFFLKGADQISLGQFGIIFYPQVTGFRPDVFHDHDKPPGCCCSVNFFWDSLLIDEPIFRIRGRSLLLQGLPGLKVMSL
jgi:hypothetical protein